MSKLKDLKFLMEKIFVPSGNLGIPRRNMPQIEDEDQDDFIDYLEDNGVHIRKVQVKAKSIKPIQKEIRADVVKSLPKIKLTKPVVISSDSYLLDGHHRWLALLQDDVDATVDAYQASCSMKKLLELAHKFPKVVYKDTRNKQYDSIEPSLKSS